MVTLLTCISLPNRNVTCRRGFYKVEIPRLRSEYSPAARGVRASRSAEDNKKYGDRRRRGEQFEESKRFRQGVYFLYMTRENASLDKEMRSLYAVRKDLSFGKYYHAVLPVLFTFQQKQMRRLAVARTENL